MLRSPVTFHSSPEPAIFVETKSMVGNFSTSRKSADFLDVEKYPTIDFVSTKITGSGDEWKVTGDLTIHGVTNPVVLDVEGPTPEAKDPWGGTRTGASASTKINRKDFGLTWNMALETGGVLVADELTIHLELELIRAA